MSDAAAALFCSRWLPLSSDYSHYGRTRVRDTPETRPSFLPDTRRCSTPYPHSLPPLRRREAGNGKGEGSEKKEK
ncbi:hypothetical protein CEXT_430811 [Caerostris extrusa]|uniref:Uncharacterized protein n=1 Tax=Caerostris extrusa TaxID=172846 RepID=A0AAV4SAV5_CAEEX|nr:hypothetical protein CEXT_430811 [Caerostris extrusa]